MLLDCRDPLALDGQLSEDELLVRDSVRRLVTDKFLPGIADHYEAGSFPADLIPALASMGLLGMHLAGYGCAGMSATAYGVACRELERGDSGLRSFVSVQGSLCMFPIWKFGSEEQKQHWLPAMARGEVIGCFGLTEPDFGSDPGGMLTRAVRDGDSWVLNGSKRWITNAPIADLAVVWARADEGILGFLIERGTPGFETRELDRKMSLRASATGEIHLDDCRVPASSQLPDARGLGSPLACLNEARYGIAWGAVGAAIACLTSALEYSSAREVFGRPLTAFQLTQAKLADLVTGVATAGLLAFRLGALKDTGKLRPEHVSMGKRHNVRVAVDTARQARAMLGANGISMEYPVIRHMMNLESVLTYEGTEEIHSLALGSALTGHSAYR